MSKERRKIEEEQDAFAKWKAEHPDGKYTDYYAQYLTERMATGKPHPTIGGQLSRDESFEESGRGHFDRLVEAGLLPEHVCVDYGCGSLRLGQHIIRYLRPGNYWGLDISDAFYNEGVRLIGEATIAEKKPNLRVIAPDSVAEAGEARPHFLISQAVMLHVPPDELDVYLGYVMTIVGEQTTALISVKTADVVVQFDKRSWAYPVQLVEEKLRALGGSAVFTMKRTRVSEAAGVEISTGRMTVTRPGA